MSLDDIVTYTPDFVRLHEMWAAPLVLVLAFGESLVFFIIITTRYRGTADAGCVRCLG